MILKLNTKIALVSLLTLFLTSKAFSQQVPLIPLPNKYAKGEGSFTLSSNTPIILNDQSLRASAAFLQQELLKHTGITLSVQQKASAPAIVLSHLKTAYTVPGSYQLKVSPDEIRLVSGTEEGLFNGLNSLLQLARTAPSKGGEITLAAWDITDSPKYEWRGLMLDESRQFFGKETVKFLIDWMAFYKLNRFHWHLTDEPGWRLEIKKYPKLTLVGGIGNHIDPTATAKYYTQEDVKDIIAYAADRFITVIPEIDMPGHAAAANKAYPEFSGGGSEKYPDFTFHPAKKATYDYLTNILKETNVLFPSGMVHLGGDEVHFGNEQWSKDNEVQSLMSDKKLGDLKAVEEYFIQRMADSLAKINSKVLLWDEAASSKLSPANTIIFWWRHDKPEQLALALSKKFPVVITPRLPLYFDFVQDSSQRVGRRWEGGFNPVDRVYNFSPSKLHTPGQASLIKGIQAALWTERIPTITKLEHMLFPRISALAESAWTNDVNKNYEQFESRLVGHLELFRKDKIYFFNPFNISENPEPFVAGQKDN
ncbi:beta-N-acetylhexosaminidase [Daejeonella lutea]|uniref:beta-N-acetylhexosaminidase n=1 Tax=Daejeonella lutea TaxID=572036 RepID=A0A1T5AJT1_9SPHI|nr:beta-N-acetylhexosaminidase [Daejeonella lutea]SKB35261.1 hexosaminidase [Daejeonella lutea]